MELYYFYYFLVLLVVVLPTVTVVLSGLVICLRSTLLISGGQTAYIKLNNKVNHLLDSVCLYSCVSLLLSVYFVAFLKHVQYAFLLWKFLCMFQCPVYVCLYGMFVFILPKSLMSDRTSQEIMAPPPSSMAPWPTSQLSK